MKISLNWLKKYIQIAETPEEVARLLTQSGLEVVEIAAFEPMQGNLKELMIGQIISCTQHPNADQLNLTLVDIGQDVPLRIVCGASNIKAGQKVVVAPAGTKLRHQEGKTRKIRKAKIRGEISEGMICAANEIGLEYVHEGVIVLNTPLTPGTPIAQHFHLQPDTILEIDITPNRADACSHMGISRELKALLDRPIKHPSVETFKEAKKHLPLQVEVNDHHACPRYSGIILRGVKVRPSPPWLANKLKAIGLCPVNNIVDTTHFVLHELGQPLHAFDYDQITGKKITVKQLNPATPFFTTEGLTKKLNGEELMVCDQAGGLSMAGIVGGKRADIRPETQNIFLESAYFNPGIIRKAAKQHALKTDASFRHERGTDPNITVYALKRACLLLQEISQGEVSSALIDLYPTKIGGTNVQVYYKNITRILGLYLPKKTVRKILQRIDVVILQEETDHFVVLVPPYRTDMYREVDVISVIARIHGYGPIEVTDKLGSTYLAKTIRPTQRKSRFKTAELLAANGYHEIYTNSLTKSAYATLIQDHNVQQQVPILNPLSETLNVLRSTLLFAGLEVIVHNIHRKQSHLKFFEFGKTYHKKGQQYIENNRLGIWLTGNAEAPNWIRQSREVSFQDIHALLHKIIRTLHFTNFAVHSLQNSFYQEGVQGIIDQTHLLTAGKVSPLILKRMGIAQSVFFADIDWDVLVHKPQPEVLFQEISKFPVVQRDVSLVLHQSVRFETVSKVITQYNNKLIKGVTVVDVYQGDKLAQGKKAYALRFVLQGKNKTLDNTTVDDVIARLMRAFEDQLGAIIRDRHAPQGTV